LLKIGYKKKKKLKQVKNETGKHYTSFGYTGYPKEGVYGSITMNFLNYKNYQQYYGIG